MKVNDELEVVMAYFMVNHTIIQVSRRNSVPKFEPGHSNTKPDC
jgi:hypothetical protein